MKNKLRVFESFAGVGSQAMALRNIGVDYEVVGISEVDRYGLLAYASIHNGALEIEIEYPSKEQMLKEIEDKHIAYNFSTNKSEIPRRLDDIKKLYKAHILSKNYGDIRLINEKELPDFDLFTYSFPCKNISVAGKQAGLAKDSGTQSSLVWECEKIIREKRPKYMLMENVKNLISKKHMPFFQEWIDLLALYGYKNYWRVLNAKDYNLPQNRERVIMISILGEEEYVFPEMQELKKSLSDLLEDLPYDNKLWKFSEGKGYNKLVRHKNKVITRSEGIPKYTSTIHAGYWKFGGRDQFYLRDNNKKIRALSPLETWRLMGFMDNDFKKAKEIGLSNSKLYERAGRGIAVPMLEEVFRNLFKDYMIK